MTLTQIHYFLCAAKLLNFTKAATELYVSQQVISHQIQLLEEDLGFPLFVREKNRLYLTDSGKLLYQMWEKQSRESHAIISQAQVLAQKQRTVCVGILELSSIIDFVMPKVPMLNQRFPNITWDYYLGDFAMIERAIDTSRVDLAVTLSTEISPQHAKNQCLLLKNLELGIFVGYAHPLYHREELSLSDLSQETFFLFSQDTSYDASNKILTDCKLSGFYPEKIQYFSNVNQLEFALLSGKGIMIGYDIFFNNNGTNLKKFPLEPREGLQKSDLVVMWQYPDAQLYAHVFCETAAVCG